VGRGDRRHFYDNFKEAIFDGRVKHLDCVYSGYGDVQTTEKERLEMLVTGQAVAVHHVKGSATGPMSEKDLNLEAADCGQSHLGRPLDARHESSSSPPSNHSMGNVAKLADAGTDHPDISEQRTKSHVGSNPTVTPPMDIFIVSFAKDAQWLLYCLRSIKKFCLGFNAVVIATPVADTEAFLPHRTEFPEYIYLEYDEPAFPLGNLHHMFMKCTADEYCGAQLIAHVDSDCLFIKPTTPADYMVDGKPVLLVEPFDVLKTLHPGRFHWKSVVDAALGGNAAYETMCRHPAVHHRDLYAFVREHIATHHGVPFEQYVLSCNRIIRRVSRSSRRLAPTQSVRRRSTSVTMSLTCRRMRGRQITWSKATLTRKAIR
jgi:hypothetical protein